MKNELRRLNFSDAGAEAVLNTDPATTPTRVSAEVMNKWLAGDDDPYYKLQRIDYPITANGIVYTESFFESFLNKTKERPIPGSKNGHEPFWGVRPPTDLLLVGGKIEKNGDGTGSVYFKNYIPKEGESGNNDIFIRENMTGMVHYSLVTYPREEIRQDEDGNQVIYCVESIKGERNDAVEYNLGAMKQVTNAGVTGDMNTYEETEEMEITKNDVLSRLNALKANGEITLMDVAEAMGLKNQVVTEEHTRAVNTLKELEKMGIKNPVEDVKALNQLFEENARAVRNAALVEAFGVSEKDESGNEKNLVLHYANKMVPESASGTELKNAIESVKADPIAKNLAGEKMDPTSETNLIGKAENKKANSTGPVLVDY